jgi:hypothetical protein
VCTTLNDSAIDICVLRNGARWQKHIALTDLSGPSVQFHLFASIPGAHDKHWTLRNPSQFDEYDASWGMSEGEALD